MEFYISIQYVSDVVKIVTSFNQRGDFGNMIMVYVIVKTVKQVIEQSFKKGGGGRAGQEFWYFTIFWSIFPFRSFSKDNKFPF